MSMKYPGSTLPPWMTRMVPRFSTTNRRSVPSPAFVTWVRDRKPPATLPSDTENVPATALGTSTDDTRAAATMIRADTRA